MTFLTLASALKPCRNFDCRYPWKPARGNTDNMISANIQLAVNDIMKPAATVTRFWTTSANVSPTRQRTVEASVDNLAPTEPLQ